MLSGWIDLRFGISCIAIGHFIQNSTNVDLLLKWFFFFFFDISFFLFSCIPRYGTRIRSEWIYFERHPNSS